MEINTFSDGWLSVHSMPYLLGCTVHNASISFIHETSGFSTEYLVLGVHILMHEKPTKE